MQEEHLCECVCVSVCVRVQIQIQIEIQIHIHIQIHHLGPRTADLGPRRCSSARCLVQRCSASSSVNKITCVNRYLCLCVRVQMKTIDADH